MQAGAADMARAAKVMQRKFDARFPQLAGMRMEYAWAGHLCLTLNGVSVMREIDDGVISGLRAERPRHRARHADGDRRGGACLRRYKRRDRRISPPRTGRNACPRAR
jgi:glycine/D-amino acid oxidase-like deaminating enzyme